MKNPGISHLKESGRFIPYKELRFSEILFFVFENIRERNLATGFYFFSNFLLLVVLLVVSVSGFINGFFSFKPYMAELGWGMLAGGILIIPFHEAFHALAFLIIGARKIRFGADLKQMLFYATAEDFVAGRKGFALVALTPFIIVNIASALFAFYTGSYILILVLLLIHNLMCIGDFAMLSFFIINKDKEMYTFDDLDTKTAWFYIKKEDLQSNTNSENNISNQ